MLKTQKIPKDLIVIVALLGIGLVVAVMLWWYWNTHKEGFSVDLGRISGFPKLDNQSYITYAGVLWTWSPANANQSTVKLLSVPSTLWQESWTAGIKQVSIEAINSWVKFMSGINTFLMWSASDYQGQLFLLPFDPKVPTTFSATNPLWIGMFQEIWNGVIPGSTWSCVVPTDYNIVLQFETGEEPITLSSGRYYNNLPYPSRLIEVKVMPTVSAST